MKTVTYTLMTANRHTDDIERAVLPTIMFARKHDHQEGATICATATALTIGWWAWGIGIIRTTVRRVE